VTASEHQRNLSNCKDGAETPDDYSKPTAPEARTVADGEQKRNYTACFNGYGYCDPFSLTPSEVEAIMAGHK
jgi:hypothetical protein